MTDEGLEGQIAQWREFLRRRRAIHAGDVEELEGHLRDQIGTLAEAGLDEDEAFLVAVKRLGQLDALSREFAAEHSQRLWKQLVTSPEQTSSASRTELKVVLGLAVIAALLVKLPELFRPLVEVTEQLYLHNAPFFVLPLLTGYFVWKRGPVLANRRWLALPFLAGALFANIYPFEDLSHTAMLSVLHMPIALWWAVGVAYAAGRWDEVDGRMDFVRFSGEFFIYYVLIALGGGVLTGFTLAMFSAIGLQVEWAAQNWIVPCGAAGAVLVSAFLVESKQSVIENMAPVLTRIFTPLFAVVLLAFLATMLFTGRGIDVEREVLIGFDLMLVVVVGLLLYTISARDPDAAPDAFDRLQLVLVVSALVVDLLALTAIAGRISDFGLSPNKVAALGENLILLANLGWSALLYTGFLRGERAFVDIERWQTKLLPVYAGWAAVVVVCFPPLFGYR